MTIRASLAGGRLSSGGTRQLLRQLLRRTPLTRLSLLNQLYSSRQPTPPIDLRHALPIRTPVAKTRPPPSMTFAAAERGAVSM